MADPTTPTNPDTMPDNELGCEGPWFKDGPGGRSSHLVKGYITEGHMFRRFSETCGVGEIGHCWSDGSLQKVLDHAKKDGVGFLVATLMDNQLKERQMLLDAGFFEIRRFKNDFTYHINDRYMLTLYGKDMEQPGNPVTYPLEARTQRATELIPKRDYKDPRK